MRGWSLLLLSGCLGGPTGAGIAATVRQGGPRVVFAPDARPLPEIPLPNDAATRIDPSSPTGRRLNVSQDAATENERDVRRKFNQLDGFGTFAPIAVRFDAPIDVDGLWARHNPDDDFRNDGVFLLNVDRDCARFGEEVALDLGRGRFPVTVYDHSRQIPDPLAPGGHVLDESGNALFPFDPEGEANNRLFSVRNEDLDGDGALSPGEDVDEDGVLDVANLDDPTACDHLAPTSVAHDQCLADHLLTWYERETDTLILRPVWPLEQRCTYAVVVSRRVTGEDGTPVESPFEQVNHRDQTEALAEVGPLLERYDLGLSDVAFAWTFTTGSMTTDLEALRAGLYGAGPFARLAQEFPVTGFTPVTRQSLAEAWGRDARPEVANDALFPGACAGQALTGLWRRLGEWAPNRCAIEADTASFGGVFAARFEAPNLLIDKDGIATASLPADEDEVWEIDAERGVATYGRTSVTMWCALPIAQEEGCTPGNPEGQPFCKPFPTVLYSHGYGGSRAEVSLHMGRHTAMGFASCGLDAYGHGLERARVDPELAPTWQLAGALFAEVGMEELPGLMTMGRDRDLNNDGLPDPGADQWTNDVFHTRDMVRQSALEVTQLVRILRHMDGVTVGADGGLLGDIDGDGVVDLGGPDNVIAHWGISLGGILSGVVAGSEPGLDAASPNAHGGGLTDVTARSNQAGVPEAVILPIVGPLVVGCLATDAHQNPVLPGAFGGDCLAGRGVADGPFPGGELRLAMFAQDTARFEVREFAAIDGVSVGDRVRLENLRTGESRDVHIGPRGWFRVAVAADALSPTERRPLLGLGDGEFGPAEISDPTRVGDPLQITVYAADSDTPRAVVASFEREVTFQGTIYPEGAALVVLQAGLGYRRNTPDFRRFVGFAASAISPADPAVWGAHTFLAPLDVAYDPFVAGGNTRVLHMPTAGDRNVPVNTGIAAARASGVLGSWLRDDARPAEQGWRELFEVDPRYGTSRDQWLIDRYVVEGQGTLQRYADNPVNPNVLFDADDVSDGAASWSCGDSDWSGQNGENACPDDLRGQEVFFGAPHPAPGDALRQLRPRGDGSFDGLRVPVLRPAGQHGIYNAQSFRTFDADAFMVDYTVRFLGSAGRLVDHPAGCDCSASEIPQYYIDDEAQFPALERTCQDTDIKVCDASCAASWGIRTPSAAVCSP